MSDIIALYFQIGAGAALLMLLLSVPIVLMIAYNEDAGLIIPPLDDLLALAVFVTFFTLLLWPLVLLLALFFGLFMLYAIIDDKLADIWPN